MNHDDADDEEDDDDDDDGDNNSSIAEQLNTRYLLKQHDVQCLKLIDG